NCNISTPSPGPAVFALPSTRQTRTSSPASPVLFEDGRRHDSDAACGISRTLASQLSGPPRARRGTIAFVLALAGSAIAALGFPRAARTRFPAAGARPAAITPSPVGARRLSLGDGIPQRCRRAGRRPAVPGHVFSSSAKAEQVRRQSRPTYEEARDMRCETVRSAEG
ncbi:hypothetical protein LTR16_004516, partial [Cryomyces antarcticus]